MPLPRLPPHARARMRGACGGRVRSDVRAPLRELSPVAAASGGVDSVPGSEGQEDDLKAIGNERVGVNGGAGAPRADMNGGAGAAVVGPTWTAAAASQVNDCRPASAW